MIKAYKLDAKTTNQKVKKLKYFWQGKFSFVFDYRVKKTKTKTKKSSLTKVLMKYIVWSEILWFGAI